jgi:hypothetical protein
MSTANQKNRGRAVAWGGSGWVAAYSGGRVGRGGASRRERVLVARIGSFRTSERQEILDQFLTIFKGVEVVRGTKRYRWRAGVRLGRNGFERTLEAA